MKASKAITQFIPHKVRQKSPPQEVQQQQLKYNFVIVIVFDVVLISRDFPLKTSSSLS